MKEKINLKLWIARDEGIYEEITDRKPNPGKLHLFYDTPKLTAVSINGEEYMCFGTSRKCCEIPSYMFPEIKEGDCIEIEVSNNNSVYKYKDFSKIIK